jgi:hypothetical protein
MPQATMRTRSLRSFTSRLPADDRSKLCAMRSSKTYQRLIQSSRNC